MSDMVDEEVSEHGGVAQFAFQAPQSESISCPYDHEYSSPTRCKCCISRYA